MKRVTPTLLTSRIKIVKTIVIALFCSGMHGVVLAEEPMTTATPWPLTSSKSLIHKQSVKILSTDKFSLSADYYRGQSDMGGVLLLHGCESDRHMYDALGQAIAQQGLNALTLDLRGYGDSSNAKFSHAAIKRKSTNIVSYQNDLSYLTSFWSKDIHAAYQYLRAQVERNKQISIVSTDCTAANAIQLADNTHINSLVLLTPKLDFIEKENYKNLNDIVTYFIASSHQVDSYKTSQELFLWNGAVDTKLQVYNGSRTGESLLRHDDALLNDIATWLKASLR